jgi:polyisoprenoid-binding protein YceI
MQPRHLIALLSAFAATAANADSYTIDPRHTFPSFEVSHYGFSMQRGRFNKVSGKLDLDSTAKKGSVEVTIDTA